MSKKTGQLEKVLELFKFHKKQFSITFFESLCYSFGSLEIEIVLF